MFSGSRLAAVALALVAVAPLAPASAQQAAGDRKAVQAQSQAGLGDAFKGFGSNSKDPIQIEADSLEVRDRDNMAVFTGNVMVRQKDTVLRTQLLRVYYQPKQAGGASAGPAPTQSQQIRRYEAEGKVLITQADQTVSGDTGWFDMPTSKAQINNNVVITQGKNVGTGGRIDVDLKTGQYVLSGQTKTMFGADGTAKRPTLVIEPTEGDGKKN